MKKENQQLRGATRKRWQLRTLTGTAVFGLLTTLGFFFWSGQANLVQEPVATAVPTQVAANPSTTTPLSTAAVTDSPEPATPTAVPTNRPTSPSTPTKTPAATATPSGTATAAPTELPATNPPPTVTTNPAETAVPVPTLEPWPTTNPTLLRRPPADMDASRSHLWFSRPVDGNNIPSAPYRFGMTYNQRLVPHRAVDIANDPGTPVVAVGPGTIFYAGEDMETLFGPKADFYGRVVVVQMDWQWEGRTIYTLYGHLESIAVTAGQVVNPGDVLGGVGSAGVALGPHLHFEVRQDDPYDYGSVRNPELWYWPFSGRGILAGRVVDANGYFIPGTRVNLECSDATPRTVDTYWDQYTAPDDVLVENFAISDLPAGTCRVWADLFGEVVEQFVEIQPAELSVVVLQARP